MLHPYSPSLPQCMDGQPPPLELPNIIINIIKVTIIIDIKKNELWIIIITSIELLDFEV